MTDTGTATRPLEGKVALVTGGSRGIGAATSLALADQGADVVLTYRSSLDEATSVAQACEAKGVKATVLQADLDDPACPQALVSAVSETVPQLDVVVSNACASYPRKPLPQLDPDALGAKVRADVVLLHHLATAFVPPMRERGFGRLVVISSGSSWGPTAPGLAAHGVTKAALEAYVRYAADELGGPGVTINGLALGFVQTQASAAVPQPAREALARATPAGRLGTPQDIAGAVTLLTQPTAEWINGTTIPVTGGLNYPLNLFRVSGGH
ncbi:SDR family oxidoreductase [Streptomyces sp. NPDC049099]|uniref:SDR family oxidoreductase n=1 Tax=unclassified Streptomyces TaxID=2593676 RepID=UPI00342B093E